MLIDLLRHDEPVGGRRYRGQTDDALSKPWQHLITSPLQRCRAFALQLDARHNMSLGEEPRFMEVGYGVWKVHTAKELPRRTPGQWQCFLADPVTHRLGHRHATAWRSAPTGLSRRRNPRGHDAGAGTVRYAVSHPGRNRRVDAHPHRDRSSALSGAPGRSNIG